MATDEFQARIQANKPFPTQHNLAKDPYALPDQAQDGLPGEANVVELPSRSQSADGVTEDVVLARPTRRKSRGSKRKAQSTSSRQSTVRSRSSDQLAYAEDLQRLEAMAERINQLLAERAQRQPYPPSSPAYAPAPVQHPPHSGRRPRQPQLDEDVWQDTLEHQDTATLHRQADRIRQLLAELEAAMAEASAEIDPSLGHPSQGRVSPWAPSSRETWRQPAQSPLGKAMPNYDDSRHHHSAHRLTLLKQPLAQVRSLLKLPRKPMEWIGDAALWIAVAAAVRVGAKLIVQVMPALSPIVLILMLAPAIAAVILAIFVPRVGWVSLYRLFLVMLGLLLGGRW